MILKQISIELLNEIANYLATKPYVEVVDLINKMAKLPDCPTRDPKAQVIAEQEIISKK